MYLLVYDTWSSNRPASNLSASTMSISDSELQVLLLTYSYHDPSSRNPQLVSFERSAGAGMIDDRYRVTGVAVRFIPALLVGWQVGTP